MNSEELAAEEVVWSELEVVEALIAAAVEELWAVWTMLTMAAR